jgi:hypothetical protein
VNAVRFKGGPLAGKTFPVPDVVGWPLPSGLRLLLSGDDLLVQLGGYEKVGQSQLSDEAAGHPNVGRVAEYEWEKNFPDLVETPNLEKLGVTEA